MTSKANLNAAEGIGALVGYVVSALVDGLGVMLACGIAHSSARGIPAFGYWESVFFAFVASQITASGTQTLALRIKKLGRS